MSSGGAVAGGGGIGGGAATGGSGTSGGNGVGDGGTSAGGLGGAIGGAATAGGRLGVGGSDPSGGTTPGGVGGAVPSAGSAGDSASGGSGDPGELTVSMDFTPSLTAANRTLIFPLTEAPLHRTPSQTAPGELVLEYTRLGCASAQSLRPVEVSPAPTARVNMVTITQDLVVPDWGTHPANELIQGTCLSLRTPGGGWQPVLPSTKVVTVDNSIQLQFELPGTVTDAVAIFVVTYPSVSQITYTIQTP